MRARSGVPETGTGGCCLAKMSAARRNSSSVIPLVIPFIGSETRSLSRNISSTTVV